jgi:hypothetical protein
MVDPGDFLWTRVTARLEQVKKRASGTYCTQIDRLKVHEVVERHGSFLC